jgi:hypothetical protein
VRYYLDNPLGQVTLVEKLNQTRIMTQGEWPMPLMIHCIRLSSRHCNVVGSEQCPEICCTVARYTSCLCDI